MDDLCRIEIRLDDPNPLFKKWIESWLKEAVEKNSKARYVLREALESLKRFPLPLQSGRECVVLKGFGPKLCKFLDEKLEDLKHNNLEEYEKSINISMSVQKVAKKYKQKQSIEIIGTIKKVDNVNAKLNSTNVQIERVVMNPGTFSIILLVDTHETAGKSKKSLDATRKFLDSSAITYEIRALNVGDFCWISRDKEGNELVLPFIVERKRMDDFASSIRDGRFHEQKYRLKDCGLENLIYVIENYGPNQHVGLPMPTLLQAATNTLIHSGFQLKFTDGHRETMMYLSLISEILTNTYKNKAMLEVAKQELNTVNMANSSVNLMKFKEFNENSVKRREPRVREIFIRQLLQLKSLSLDKALAITKEYPTPRALVDAYQDCSTPEKKDRMLANIPCGKLKRPIGAFISKTICQFYSQLY